MARLIVILIILFSASSCSFVESLRPKSLAFLPNYSELKEQRERAPFQAYWEDDQVMLGNLKSYKLYIKPVDYQLYREYLQAERFSTEDIQDFLEEARELGRYFKNKLTLSLIAYRQADPKRLPIVVLVEEPEIADFSLALTFVKIKPANPTVNLIGTVLGFFVPGGGAIKLTVSSYISIAGFLESESTKEVVAFQFYDKEGEKFYPFTFKDFQRYAHTRVAIDDWSMQIVELLHTSSNQRVEDSSLIGIDLF